MPAVEKLSDKEIAELVDRGGECYQATIPLKKIEEELHQIKAKLREQADGHDRVFRGKKIAAFVEQKPDGICTKVPPEDVPWLIKVAGPELPEIVDFVPKKNGEKSVEVNLLKRFARKLAATIMKKWTRPTTAWVRFVPRSSL